jgi:hypothetical protein
MPGTSLSAFLGPPQHHDSVKLPLNPILLQLPNFILLLTSMFGVFVKSVNSDSKGETMPVDELGGRSVAAGGREAGSY